MWLHGSHAEHRAAPRELRGAGSICRKRPLAVGPRPRGDRRRAGAERAHPTAQGAQPSFLPPRLDIDRNDVRTATGAEVVTCRRLDELHDVDGTLAIHLKIDVQGSELDVYRSAGKVADRIVSLELEMSLIELYEGQPLIEVVIDHVRRDGFVPVTLTRGYRFRRSMVECSR